MIALAVRYLLSRQRQTLLMLLGIFFGTAAYVAISGFMLGFREFLVDQLVNNSAHIHIQAREDYLTEHSLDQPIYNGQYTHVFWDPAPSGRKDSAIVENPQSWYNRLNADPRVAAFSPQLTTSAIFTNGKATASAVVIGCDPESQVKVTNIGDYIVEGKFSDLAGGGNRLIIGAELKKRLGVRLSQTIMTSAGRSAPMPFKIVGVYQTGNKMADVQAYGAISDVQRLNRTPNQVNEIAVKLFDHTQSAALATQWASISEEKIESWDQINASLFDVFRIQDAVRFLSVGAIMIVAGFGIYNVLNMTVIQKRRDVAILRSMGFETRDIVVLFFSQGMMLGICGTILGLTAGFFICSYLETVSFGGGPTTGGFTHLLISKNPAIYVQSAIFAQIAALLASVLPAYSAGKLTPIEIIRAGTE